MKDLLIYAVFRALCAVCHLLGRSGSAGLGCLIGLACSMLDRRRGRIMANIARGFGRARAYGIAKRYYEHLGLILVEYAQLGRIDPGGLEAWIDAAAVGRVRDATASGRGVIIMTGHVGNWELTGYALTRSGVPLNSLYRPVGNEYLDRRLRRLRERIGQRTHGKLGSMRWSLEVLRRCEMLGLLVDQDGGRAGVFAPMFGRLASTLPTAAKLARKTGAAILPTASFRLRDRRQHRLVVGPEVLPADTGDKERDVLLTTHRCNLALEKIISAHPGQWLWSHRRWHTAVRPEDARAWSLAASMEGGRAR